MSTGLLEEVGIADMLFGENQVLEVKDDFDPDAACFCVCGCVDSTDKRANSSATNMNAFAAMPTL